MSDNSPPLVNTWSKLLRLKGGKLQPSYLPENKEQIGTKNGKFWRRSGHPLLILSANADFLHQLVGFAISVRDPVNNLRRLGRILKLDADHAIKPCVLQLR